MLTHSPLRQTQDQLSDAFRDVLKARPLWLPKNVRRVKWSTISANADRNALGLLCDAKEASGKIVHLDDTLLVLKAKPSVYCLVDMSLIPKYQTLVLGSKVTLSPYKRKSLVDGLALDAPRVRDNGVRSVIIGETQTRLPERPSEGYLADLADQLEALPMPDGYRTIANALADWQATDFTWVQDDKTITYVLRFTMTAPTYTGPMKIIYDRACDTYSLRYDAPGSGKCDPSLPQVTDIHFDELAGHLSHIAGDQDSWCLVTVSPVT
ncbi:MAG: hypothetical protein AAF066_02345 [Pseudomonadota bacterium]